MFRVSRASTVAAAVASIASIPLAASAANPKAGVLVLELEVQGLPDKIVQYLDAEMRGEVKAILSAQKSGKLLPKPALDFDGMKLAAGCGDDGPKCLQTIGDTLGASKVMRAILTGNAERARATLIAVDTATGEAKRQAAELAAIDEESGPEWRVHVAAAMGVKKKLPEGALVLYIASDIGKLDGAEIFLDDKKVPKSALESVSPGLHRVEVRQKGFETFIWMGAARPGRKTQIAVSFEPSGGGVAAQSGNGDGAAASMIAPSPPRMPEKSAGGSATPVAASASAAPSEPSAPPTPAIPSSPEPHDRVSPPGSAAAATPVAADAPVEGGGKTRIVTWILAGGAVVAGAVGLIHGIQIGDRELELESPALQAELAAMCTEGVDCGPTICDVPSPPEACADGDRTTMIANVAWISAGVLAAGAIVAFFVEGSGSGDTEVSGAVAPTKGGAAASISVRF